MHQVVERLERLLTLLVLLFLGIGLTHGLLSHLDWRGVVVGLALVFVIRPLSGLLALSVGRGTRMGRNRDLALGRRERLATAFFGVRGVGSIYYLAYAAGPGGLRRGALALVDGRRSRSCSRSSCTGSR